MSPGFLPARLGGSWIMRIGVVAVLVALASFNGRVVAPQAVDRNDLGTLELEVKSKYSHIRIRKSGTADRPGLRILSAIKLSSQA